MHLPLRCVAAICRHAWVSVGSGLAVAACLLALAPAASAQGLNVSADYGAMTAYHSFLNTMVSASTSSSGRAGQIISAVGNSCPGALSDLSSLSASQLNRTALSSLGAEIDADLDISYLAPSSAALNRFAGALGALDWAGTGPVHTTNRLIAAERSLVHLQQSDICKDATLLDAAPRSEPARTGAFLTRYNHAEESLTNAVSGFQALLVRYETTSEHKLVSQINALVTEFSAQSSATEQSDGEQVLGELGVTYD